MRRAVVGLAGLLITVVSHAQTVGSAQHHTTGPDGNGYASMASGDITRFDLLTGQVTGIFIKRGVVRQPSALVFGPDGLLYVADFRAGSVLRFHGHTGALVDVFVKPGSGGLSHPDVLVFAADGCLYVGSSGNNTLLRFHGRTGAFLPVAGNAAIAVASRGANAE